MSQQGYVYIVHGIGTFYIKIGTTIDLQRELKHIGRDLPFRVRLLSASLVYNVDMAAHALKTTYHAFHAWGEWFDLPAEVMAQWPEHEEHAVLQPHPPVLRVVRRRPSLPERLTTVLRQRGPMTARRLQAYTYRKTAPEIRAVLAALVEAGTVRKQHVGKTTLYWLAQAEAEGAEVRGEDLA